MKHFNSMIIGLTIVVLGFSQYITYNKEWEQEIRAQNERHEYQRKLRTIVVYIHKVNKDVSISKAKEFAEQIMKSSAKRGIDPFVQTALLKTESSFYTNPNHGIRQVKGMGGVYWKWWSKDLKKHDICDTICDLEDPIINIKASAYILSEYKKLYKSQAIAHYKGYSSLGKQQAKKVLATAEQIRKIYYMA